MNFSGIFGHILGTTGLILSFLIFPHDSVVFPSHAKITPPVVTPTASVTGPVYTATDHYSYQGYTATITFSIPKSGGGIRGTISGDCTGQVTGMYDGKEDGNIQGKIAATCHAYFFAVPVTGSYSGVVHTAEKKVDVTVDVSAQGFEKSQQVSLQLH